ENPLEVAVEVRHHPQPEASAEARENGAALLQRGRRPGEEGAHHRLGSRAVLDAEVAELAAHVEGGGRLEVESPDGRIAVRLPRPGAGGFPEALTRNGQIMRVVGCDEAAPPRLPRPVERPAEIEEDCAHARHAAT